MIYYLAQAYSIDPKKAFIDAVSWTNQLRKKQLDVFSPILHTHNYNLVKTTWDRTEEDYVAWDLALLAAMCLPNLIPYRNCNLEYAMSDNCPNKTSTNDLTICCKSNCPKCVQYQPNVTLLFAPTCFNIGVAEPETLCWASKGAYREYQFAKKKHIRCLLLDPFKDRGEEVEI